MQPIRCSKHLYKIQFACRDSRLSNSRQAIVISMQQLQRKLSLQNYVDKKTKGQRGNDRRKRGMVCYLTENFHNYCIS
jgi:hypothetical protein